MKKALLLLAFPLLSTALWAQQKEEAEKLVSEGIAWHDKGNYDEAIRKYDQALLLDKDNLLALAEKAMSLVSLKKNEEALVLCQLAIEKHPGEEALSTVYVTYGNACDALGKTDKAIEAYDEGIKLFPDSYQLYFNKGITLAIDRKYDDAIGCFQKSALRNPSHASSHNALARLLNVNGKRIPSLLAYSRFLVVESETNRAKENLAAVQKIMKGNVEKKGENSVSISISTDMLGAAAAGKPEENSFSTTDLLLTMDAGLDYDKKNKKKTEVEQFIRKFEAVCASLKEGRKDNYGFYWSYYVPYFVEMKDQGFIETFGYIIFSTSDDAVNSNWLKAHQAEIDRFYDWSATFAWKAN